MPSTSAPDDGRADADGRPEPPAASENPPAPVAPDGSAGAVTPAVPEAVAEELYRHLHRIADGLFRHQPADHTLQPTAVLHEAFVKLAESEAAAFRDRGHFLAVATRAMRQVLVDHARRRSAAKRGGGRRAVQLDESLTGAGADGPAVVDILALDEALDELERLDPRQARVVELRFIGGLSLEETARLLDVSPRTIQLDWRMARAWLSRRLGEDA